MNNIYISSVAFTGKEIESVIQSAQQHNWAIEFSSGLSYRKDLEDIYLQAPIKKMPHNYFPPPEDPFVLNLASSDNKIREFSIAHCINGLSLAKRSLAPFFSAHAGFCIDPDVKELGNRINIEKKIDKENSWSLFFDSLKQVLNKAEELEINFLIENNVIAPFNFTNNINPLLCCSSAEINYLFKEIRSARLGLLLDTAHLKVSCNTLQLDLHQEVYNLSKFIRAIHHSDNDGTADTNELLNEKYWFLQLIKNYKDIPHVIEVKNINIWEIERQIKLLQYHGN